MKRKLAVTMVLLFGLLAAAARAQEGAKAGAKAKERDNSAASAPDPSVGAATYIIGADDTLHIDVWKEPDLTATLPVRSDGMISLPLLNDVQAAGLTPMHGPPHVLQ